MGDNMFNFEKLRVYQDALIFIDIIYEITQSFPKQELFGITTQLQRAAVSISLNIAEGSSRTKKDFHHFLDISRGSCYECAAIMTIAKKRRYISDTDYEVCYQHCTKLAKMISALKASIK